MSTDLFGSQHEEEDEDSLFGSPPPSPRGRSPSPALALPSSSRDTQNVGTIALPGSHPYSELPVNPLASSSSLPEAPRPPAQGVNRPPVQQPWPTQSRPGPSASTSSGPSRSRTSSAAPPSKPKKKSKAKSKESTPRPPGPEITLPDPSAPLPTHFLRNQSALLGTAGLVGGVKPSNLTTNRQTRGTTSSNPIVVEDEADTPAIGKSHFRHPYTRPIDPSLLPAPTNQEIVSVLIRQKDIFPVLESILKLIASGSVAQPQSTGFERRTPAQRQQQEAAQASTSDSSYTLVPSTSSSSSGPPPKKRKLNRVPAGAADWDVPYPFANGEGPESYRTTWEKERGKQLISQLVNLIKTAAHKAATKSYMQNEENRRIVMDEQRRLREERQREGDKGKENRRESGSIVSAGNTPSAQSNLGLPHAPSSSFNPPPTQSQLQHYQSQQQPQPSTPFDQLISSLLAASPEQGLPSTGGGGINPNATLYSGGAAHPSPANARRPAAGEGTGAGGGVDQDLFDSWMSVLQTFPVPTEGFAQPSDSAISSGSTPAPEDFGLFDSGGFDFDMDMNFGVPISDGPSAADFEALMSSLSGQNLTQNSNTMDIDGNSAAPATAPGVLPPLNAPDINHLIDPTLLAISVPQPVHPNDAATLHTNGSNSNAGTQPPSLAPSPIPSINSFGGPNDPATPTSAIWDMSLPDVFTDTGVGELGILERQDRHVDDAEVAAMLMELGKRQDKGKGREMDYLPYTSMMQQQGLISAAVVGTHMATAIPRASTFGRTPISASALVQLVQSNSKGVKSLNREEILRKAKERRKQLAEELDRMKMQLWETTIEQGALTHLVKHFNEVESITT